MKFSCIVQNYVYLIPDLTVHYFDFSSLIYMSKIVPCSDCDLIVTVCRIPDFNNLFPQNSKNFEIL